MFYKNCKKHNLQLLEMTKVMYNETAKNEIPDKTKGVIQHDR